MLNYLKQYYKFINRDEKYYLNNFIPNSLINKNQI